MIQKQKCLTDSFKTPFASGEGQRYMTSDIIAINSSSFSLM